MDLCQLPGLMTQASLLAKLEPVQPRTRAASVLTVERVGIKMLNLLYMVNIKMEFRHPKYYKELRKRNKEEARAQLKVPSSNLDQAISLRAHDGERERAPGPGPKLQATSNKPQAPSSEKKRPQASSPKQQASSSKPQATSSEI